MKQQLENNGRRASDLHILGVSVIVGKDAEDVENQYQTTAALVSVKDALSISDAISNITISVGIRSTSRSRTLAIWGKTASAAPRMR